MIGRRRARTTRRSHVHNVARATLAVFTVLGPVLALLGQDDAKAAPDPRVGAAGTNTSLPSTDSELKVRGRGAFADVEITVNQTRNLTTQAVSVSWTGARPTAVGTGPSGSGPYGENYMQIVQCWGDDDGTHPDNPGPAPEHCVQGALNGDPTTSRPNTLPQGFASTRVISATNWKSYDASVGVTDPTTGLAFLPFEAVDGSKIPFQSDYNFNPSLGGGNFWLNPFFNIVTTNETAGVTAADGSGAQLFQVLTGVESPGLGCGQKLKPAGGGDPRVPKCWLVVVPRGTHTEENAGSIFEVDPTTNAVGVSPMAPSAWKNRIAVPIEFNSVDSACTLADQERRMAGNEMAITAIANWQPSLCASGTLPPFSYVPVTDSAARQQVQSGSTSAPGMVVVSKPVSSNNPSNPIVYAPLTASGVVIGFNVERRIRGLDPQPPPEENPLEGVRVETLNLTPRLVAKLLSQSYVAQMPVATPKDYTWITKNPRSMAEDPDFIQFNPEFTFLRASDERTFGGLIAPPGNSDAAAQVWEWILADPEAKAWLDGTPDEWGMNVNPYFSTSPSVNPYGLSFASPVPSSFPKGDPYCFQESDIRYLGTTYVPPPLCGIDYLPYARGLGDASRVTALANPGARIVKNDFPKDVTDIWKRELPQTLGLRSILGLTDTPSAALFGLQTARLSRAGDNGAERKFIAPDSAGLTAGIEAMRDGNEAGFLEPSPTVNAPDAYPLTTLTYAAISPLSQPATARSDYAAFLDYAAGPGQVSGTKPGELPNGYVTLPPKLKTQISAAAAKVRTLQASTAATAATTPAVVADVNVAPQESSTDAPAAAAAATSRSSTRSSSSSSSATTTTVTTATSEPTESSVAAPVASAPPTTAAPERERTLTPGTLVGISRLGIPFLAGLIPLAGLIALEITKRDRHAVVPPNRSLPGQD